MSGEPGPEPSEGPHGRRRIGNLFVSLTVPRYGIYASSQLASTIAIFIQRVVQDWVVFELTGNAALVGVLVMFQFGPTLLLGMWGGVLVDRRSTKTILIITQAGAAVIALALTVLAFTQQLSAGLIFAAVGIVGCLQLVDQPARQVYVGEIVGSTHLPNAISLNSSIFQVGTMVGPAIGGLLIPLGSEWAFLSGSILALASLVLLVVLGDPAHPRERAPRSRGQIREALLYCLRTPAIFWTLLVLIFVSLLGLNWPVLLTAMAERVFGTGGTGYGLYTSVVGAGAILGALLSLRRTSVRLRSVYINAVGFMAFKLLAGLVDSQALFVAALALAGCFNVLMWTASNTMLQSSSRRSIRGRVMSLYLLIAVGGQAIGAPVLGWIVEQLSPRWGMIISAGVPLIAALLIGTILAVRHARSAQ